MYFKSHQAPSNSIKQILEYLKHNPLRTETQIMKDVFGYSRGPMQGSNKKYAAMLRRGYESKKLERVEGKFGKSRFAYYVHY